VQCRGGCPLFGREIAVREPAPGPHSGPNLLVSKG
jgi:hypothetical protein